MSVNEIVSAFADEAESQGSDSSDTQGIVRSLVTAHGLGFNCWFCVCCELADRQARRAGFSGSVDHAFNLAQARVN